MYHYRARAYNPAVGKFLQTDPILQEQGQLQRFFLSPQALLAYAYLQNNPVNFTDPTGRETCTLKAGTGRVGGVMCYYTCPSGNNCSSYKPCGSGGCPSATSCGPQGSIGGNRDSPYFPLFPLNAFQIPARFVLSQPQ